MSGLQMGRVRSVRSASRRYHEFPLCPATTHLRRVTEGGTGLGSSRVPVGPVTPVLPSHTTHTVSHPVRPGEP